MRIGDLSDPPAVIKGDDPYDTDPERHPGLKFHNNKPCNAEVPPELMMDNWCTPNPVWFIRHHHPVPIVEEQDFKLLVEGDGTLPVALTMEDLKKRFLKREVATTIQCGGNRRSEFNKVDKTSGITWGFGAVSTAKWGGVYLREVLMHCAGLSLEGVSARGIEHVVFHGLDDMQASIPIEKALSPFGDVLIAYEMNGEPLPAEHGAPIRVVVPGVVGVRNVKWVSKIRTSQEEAEGTWQRGAAYKPFAPGIKSFDGVDLSTIPSIQEMPVQSSIVYPKPGAKTELDDVEVKGFAWSGGGRGIIRVDVSLDNGNTWTTAELKEGHEQPLNKAWAWTFWEASIEVPEHLRGKEIEICCRATDSSCNVQPERLEPIWNIRGLNCNSWHRVTIQHDDSD
jgi:sulfite oxidase